MKATWKVVARVKGKLMVQATTLYAAALELKRKLKAAGVKATVLTPATHVAAYAY